MSRGAGRPHMRAKLNRPWQGPEFARRFIRFQNKVIAGTAGNRSDGRRCGIIKAFVIRWMTSSKQIAIRPRA